MDLLSVWHNDHGPPIGINIKWQWRWQWTQLVTCTLYSYCRQLYDYPHRLNRGLLKYGRLEYLFQLTGPDPPQRVKIQVTVKN